MRAMSSWFDAYDQAFEAGTWDELRRGCHPSFVFDDRRRMALLHGDLDLMVASARERAAMGARPEWHSVGFFGERVVVLRVLWVGGPSDGPFEIEYLGVAECDDNGLLTAIVLFDLDDARAAQREAWTRWAAVEPDVAAVVTPIGDALDAFNEKSAAKWRAAFADGLVVEDHRLAGMGRIDGADSYTESVVAPWKIAPVTHGDAGWRWLALDRHGVITVLGRTGTVPDGGGDLENEYLYLVAQGRITRVEMFEMNVLDKALARFEELRGSDGTTSAETPATAAPTLRANAATRARDRQHSAVVAHDWDAIRRLAATDFVLEDRGKRALVTGDVEAWIASMQFTSQPGFRPRATLIGTFGDRIALDRVVWSGDPGGEAFEFERFRVLEDDAESRMRAVIMCDPEDRWPASHEAMMRFAAIKGAECARVWGTFGEAVNAKRWDDARTFCAPDFVLVDHRPLMNLGTLDREQYVESLQAIDGLSEGLTYASYDVRAWNESCVVIAIARHGTVPDGGGDFLDGFLNVIRVAHGHLLQVDVFAEHDTEGALACFDDQRSRR